MIRTQMGAPRLALLMMPFALAAAIPAPAKPDGPGKTIGRWLFNEGKGEIAGDGADGATNGRIIRAVWSDGHDGKALSFEDYSLTNYARPDVNAATRVVVPHNDRLNPSGPFTLRAVIFPTRDPVYYGGIFEKGRDLGASYRLLLLRGLRIRATAGVDHATVTSAEPVTLDSWHVVEMVVDGSTLRLRVDGKEQGRAAGVKGPFTNREEVLVGERFSGKIDEISLTAP